MPFHLEESEAALAYPHSFHNEVIRVIQLFTRITSNHETSIYKGESLCVYIYIPYHEKFPLMVGSYILMACMNGHELVPEFRDSL